MLSFPVEKMKKWGKRILIVCGIMSVLMLAAVLCIHAFFDIRQYKPQIEKQISHALGLPVILEGEIEISLFPWIGFSVENVSVGNPPDFQEKNFIRLQSFEVRVELLPLLSKNIRVRRIVLLEPGIILEKNPEGRGNWEYLGKKRESGNPPPQSEENAAMQAFAVDDLSIVRGRILWTDPSREIRQEISDVNLQIKDISPDRPITFSFSARTEERPVRLEGSIGPVKDGSGRIPLDISCTAAELSGLGIRGYAENLNQKPAAELAVEISPFSPRAFLSAWKIPFSLELPPDSLGKFSMKALLKGNADEISLENGNIELDDSRAEFSLHAANLSGLTAHPDAKGELKIDLKLDTLDLNRYRLSGKGQEKAVPADKSPAPGKAVFDESLLKRLDLAVSLHIGSLKSSPAAFEDINLSLHGKEGKSDLRLSFMKEGQPFSLECLAGPLNKGNVPIEIAVRALQQLKADIKGRITNVPTQPEADVSVEIAAFSPRKFLQDMRIPFPLETAGSETFDNAAFSGKIKADADAVSLSGGRLKLDSSSLDFSFQGKNFSVSPDLRFEGKLDSIDLNPYLPPEKTADSGNKAVAEAKSPDYAPLRNLSLEGSFRAGQLRVAKTQMRNLQISISGKKGVFRVNPLTADVYEGKLVCSASADIRGNTPVTDLSADVQNLQIRPLLRDFRQKDFLEGKTRASISLQLKGDRPEQIRANLDGKGEILFTDGAIRGIDLTKMVRNIDKAFDTGLLREAPTGGDRTDFSEFGTRFGIQKGVVNVSDISFVSPFLRAEGRGTADINRETLDFRLTPKFVGTVTAKGDAQQYKGIMVPLLISGTFTEPVFRPDLLGMIRMVPEETLTEILRDPKKGIDKLIQKDTLDNILKPKKKKEGEQEKKPAPIEEKIGDFLKKLPFGQ